MAATTRKSKVSKIQPIAPLELPTVETTTAAVPDVAATAATTTHQEEPRHNVILYLKVTQADLAPHHQSFIPPPPLNTTHDTHHMPFAHKLKTLETQLHNNFCENEHGACFWCTCEFKATPVHIPKYIMNGTYHVYGHFCSPECAAGYLMNSDIDTSSKFNSFALLNSLYGKIFGYTTSIRPAPNPHYLLNKFCGNLTIEEYRNIHRITNKQLFIVDKPLVKLMPELHQDMGDILLYNKLLSGDILGGGGNAISAATSAAAPPHMYHPIPPPPPKNSCKSAFKALFTKQNSDGTTAL